MKVEKLKPEAELLIIDQIKSVTHNFEKTFPWKKTSKVVSHH